MQKRLIVEDETAVSAALQARLKAEIQERAVASRPRVLVAEDDGLLSSALVHGTRHYGFDSLGVRDGREVLQRLAEERFDVVLLDLDLPGVNGCEILARLRDDPGAPPVVVLTGADSALTSLADRIGAQRVLRKPTLPHLVAEALTRALDDRCQGARTGVESARVLR